MDGTLTVNFELSTYEFVFRKKDGDLFVITHMIYPAIHLFLPNTLLCSDLRYSELFLTPKRHCKSSFNEYELHRAYITTKSLHSSASVMLHVSQQTEGKMKVCFH
ncbi:hypothetical protein LOAG_03000 [Loa loa]|uniref:Uncharacterized protein n=1 Tax=Loa loa TaxID=7209 RepID=A0A1S0U572_LOALO|nr:hypothetical protein LOAG_03000 [Loa loa]EFO25487.1 hypothetical protein LOAG_03000 [Loa loa]